VETLLAMPAVREWLADGAAESVFIASEEVD
jgi:hypothetical protein